MIKRKEMRELRKQLEHGLVEEEEEKRLLAESEEEREKAKSERTELAHLRSWEKGPEWDEEKAERVAGIMQGIRERQESGEVE